MSTSTAFFSHASTPPQGRWGGYKLSAIALLLAIMALAPAAAAAPPALFFSDLDWGPKTGWEGSATKGAAVSIWGLNFGSTRGSSFVTVNGVQLTSASDYAEWGVTSSARGLQRITFWLNSNCDDGPGWISVNVGGQTSASIPFTVAPGKIYFVAPNGSNSNAGSSTAAPWKDIAMFNPGKNPSGDGQYIVYVRDGTYTALDVDSAFVALRGPYGGPSSRKALVAFPGESPLLNVTNASRGVIWNATYSPYGRNNYFTYAKLHMNGGTMAFGLWGDFLRVVGNTMDAMQTNSWTGVVMVDGSQQVQILGNLFASCGYDSYKHNIYIKTHANYVSADKSVDQVTVGWNEFADPVAGSDNRGGAIFVSRASDSGSKFVDHVYIHSNYFHGGNMEFIYTGDSTPHNGDIWVYNNVFRDNSNGAGGLFFAWGTRNAYVYNNTFYGLSGEGMMAVTSTSQVFSKNNIFYSTGTPHLKLETYQGATFNSQNDLFYGAAAPSGAGITLTGAKSGSPLFVSSSDLHIQASSPAVSAGASVSPVEADFAGVYRPQGGGWDIGAYEYDQGQQSASVAVAVSPTSAQLSAGQVQQFTATVSGSANQAVTWSLSPSTGTLSSTGLYTAPSSIAAQTTVTIKAVSAADSSASATASITLTPAAPVSLTVSPTAVSLSQGQTRQFTATVSGSTTQTVTWSLSPAVGTISAAGLYTAPASVSAQTVVTVKAVAAADTSVSATATVTLTPPATPTSIAISPATVSLSKSQSRQFTVTCTSGSMPSIKWSRYPAVGALVNGLYTAPSSITAPQKVTVTATSTTDASVQASAVVDLIAQPDSTAVTVTVSPTSATLFARWRKQFQATVTGTDAKGVTWSISPAVGKITASGYYTAPSRVTKTQTVTIRATSVTDPTKSATATVTLKPLWAWWF